MPSRAATCGCLVSCLAPAVLPPLLPLVPRASGLLDYGRATLQLFQLFTSGSEECFGELYQNVASLHRAGFGRVTRLISPVGSFMAPLSLLSTIEIEPGGYVLFFDINPLAISYAKVLLKLVQLSRSPAEFMSLIYGRDAREFERRHGKLDALNQLSFAQMPVEAHLRSRLMSVLSSEEQAVFNETLLKQGLDADCGQLFKHPCLWPAFDPRWQAVIHDPAGLGLRTSERIGHLRSFFPKWSPPVNHGAWMYGLGWLSDASSFDDVRHKLPLVRFSNAEFVAALEEEDLCGLPDGSKIVLFTMDMVKSGYLPISSRREMERFLREWSCGHSFAWIQSQTCSKGGLCNVVTPDGAISSCSDWDARDAVVLSKTVGEVVDALHGCGLAEVGGNMAYPRTVISYPCPRQQYELELVG